MQWNKRLGEYEWVLRVAQAEECLEGIQANLRLRAFLEGRQTQGTTGVASSTRSKTALQNCTNRINHFSLRYRKAQSALASLAKVLDKGHHWSLRYRTLANNDVRPLPKGYELGEGRATLSWIWLEVGVEPNNDASWRDGKCLLFFR